MKKNHYIILFFYIITSLNCSSQYENLYNSNYEKAEIAYSRNIATYGNVIWFSPGDSFSIRNHYIWSYHNNSIFLTVVNLFGEVKKRKIE